MPFRSRILVGILVLTWLAVSADASGQSLSRDATEEFLRTAEVVNAEPVGSGTTFPWRLTLSDGTTTHDALFQTVEDRRPTGRLANGQVVLNFADSFEFNIAAYRLAKLVGLGHMVPGHGSPPVARRGGSAQLVGRRCHARRAAATGAKDRAAQSRNVAGPAVQHAGVCPAGQ